MIKCDKCGKDISKDYCKLSYKIIDYNDKTKTFKGNLCRRCLSKEEDILFKKSKTISRISETVSLHEKPHKKKRS